MPRREEHGLRVDRLEDVLVVTFDRPARRNAMDGDMLAALEETVSGAPVDVRAVVLTGAGDAFSAGADLRWMAGREQSAAAARVGCSVISKVFAALDAAPVPVIARVNGVAVGGGVGLVAIADVAVAADGASFQLAEVRLGLVPAMVMPYVARRIGPGRAREWALTGERIDAAQALAWGLVGTVVPADRLDDAVAGKIELLRAGAPGALAALKSFLHRASVLPPAQAAEEAVDLIAERIASEEARELIRAFAERKRGPRPA